MNACIRLPHKECFSNPILQSIVRDLKSDFSLNFPRKTQSRKIGVFISLLWHKIRWVIEKDYIEIFPTQINHHRILRKTVCNSEGFRFNREEAVQEDKSDLDAIERDFTLKIETYAFRMLNFNIRIFYLQNRRSNFDGGPGIWCFRRQKQDQKLKRIINNFY